MTVGDGEPGALRDRAPEPKEDVQAVHQGSHPVRPRAALTGRGIHSGFRF